MNQEIVRKHNKESLKVALNVMGGVRVFIESDRVNIGPVLFPDGIRARKGLEAAICGDIELLFCTKIKDKYDYFRSLITSIYEEKYGVIHIEAQFPMKPRTPVIQYTMRLEPDVNYEKIIDRDAKDS